MTDRIQDRARGRWRDIMRGVGLTDRQLSGHHAACPLCRDGGGKDRFRFDDKRGDGTWICNRCGAGGGVDFVMKFKGVDFTGAKSEIEKYLGASKVRLPKAQVSSEEATRRAETGWSYTTALDGSDCASHWLANRGIKPKIWPSQIRWSGEVPYRLADQTVSYHPCMVAKCTAPDGATFALHRTHLTPQGYKAKVADVRKFAPGPIPQGGAVRLAAAAEHMGIATGIETSYSCMKLFRLPVWAALNDGLLLKWRPPARTHRITIFGDNDVSYSGQMAAYGLAYHLKQQGFDVVEVRIPDRSGWDWNDVDMADQGLIPAAEMMKERQHENDRTEKIVEHQGSGLRSRGESLGGEIFGIGW